MFCQQCGKQLKPGASFCTACGTHVAGEAPPDATMQFPSSGGGVQAPPPAWQSSTPAQAPPPAWQGQVALPSSSPPQPVWPNGAAGWPATAPDSMQAGYPGYGAPQTAQAYDTRTIPQDISIDFSTHRTGLLGALAPKKGVWRIPVHGIGGMSMNDLHAELQQGATFRVYTYCISVIIMTFKRTSSIYFVRPNESGAAKGLPYTLLSFVAGWWSFPWGFIWTPTAIISNLRGGKDLTQVVATILDRDMT